VSTTSFVGATVPEPPVGTYADSRSDWFVLLLLLLLLLPLLLPPLLLLPFLLAASIAVTWFCCVQNIFPSTFLGSM